MGRVKLSMFACLIVLAAGCGGPRDKAEVVGNVMFSGEPVADGRITFFTAPFVPAGSGAIKNGRFQFLSKPGKMTVEITATREGKYDDREKAATREQYLPAKYNTHTQLTAEVNLTSTNRFEFSLVPE